MAKKAKPESTLAKADAALTAVYRKIFPDWDKDAARFGIRVADYNAGYLARVTEAKRKSKSKRK